MQEPEIKTVEQSSVGIKTEPAGQIAYPATDDRAWQEWAETVKEFTAQLPTYTARFFSDYKQPLLTVGLFIAAIITVKVTLALLDAVNDIPLLAPGLELVGLGYTGWFVYRYLLKAADRQELVAEIEKLKGQVFGSNY